MTPQQLTTTEKDALMAHYELEHRTTIRVLRAFPSGRATFRPHETSMTAIETARMMAGMVPDLDTLLAPELTMTGPTVVPGSWAELISVYERDHAALIRRLRALPEDALNVAIQVPVAKDRTEAQRRADVLWYFLHAQIHHRGQLSVYLRMVGGRVPSIYGPSGDEPW